MRKAHLHNAEIAFTQCTNRIYTMRESHLHNIVFQGSQDSCYKMQIAQSAICIL